MKTQSMVLSYALAVGIGLFAALPAQASCQSICVRLYNLCLASGESPAACEAEREACFADCVASKPLSLQARERKACTAEAKRAQCAYRAPAQLRLTAS
ncbi:hypothetical protein [Lysobacter silvisoli]|uniref:DUF3551 domain-containing protein n=1 Tax=Lysobacter silvisoli TaxID=2293254 RepID=A0A371K4D5_9GAMM|nr:hypothetical protein [Lysobacter silvisoli]RDZ28775.1 hypothetical protein DX914_06560 [Lysobacter silvisoli]